MNNTAMAAFKASFLQSSTVSVATYSLSIRFIAAILICVACVMAVSSFQNSFDKESDTFVLSMVFFAAKVFVSVCFSLLFLLY